MRSVAIGVLTAILLAPSTATAWGFEAHKFIVSRAIDILPEPLRPFFEANRAFIVERAIDPDLWRNAGFTEEPPNHFLDFDAYGPYPFKDLPRAYDEALKKHGIDKLKQNGLLPWRTHEIAGRLIRGFEALRKNGPYAQSDIRFFSAIIGHYVADAHVPLHAVLNYNGQLTGQTGIHNRWEDDLFVRYQKQIVIRPGAIASIANERDFIFETLLESSQLADDVLAADKKAIGNREVYDDQYFETLFAETRPILEKRLTDAIMGVASIITSAWEQAGKPTIVGRSSTADPAAAPQRFKRSAGQPLMDVYLIPVGPDRYELYCEHDGPDGDVIGDVPPQGRLAKLYANFKEALARVEEERLSGVTRVHDRPLTWTERMKDRGLCWIAEKIAEQRLLWRLRNESELMLHYPDDITEDAAMATARAELQREADRHMKWIVIDGLLFVGSGVFFFVPGPNVIAYYFGFRLVGHYLSRRGARHGLTEVRWQSCASPELSRLRRVLALDPNERDREVHEVASALQLPHLAKFFERTSVKTA